MLSSVERASKHWQLKLVQFPIANLDVTSTTDGSSTSYLLACLSFLIVTRFWAVGTGRYSKVSEPAMFLRPIHSSSQSHPLTRTYESEYLLWRTRVFGMTQVRIP